MLFQIVIKLCVRNFEEKLVLGLKCLVIIVSAVTFFFITKVLNDLGNKL